MIDALKQARAAWREIRKHEHDETTRERVKLKRALREAHAIAERAAYEAFRQMLSERHAVIRERQDALRERRRQ